MTTIYEKLKERDRDLRRDAKRTASRCQAEGRTDLAQGIYSALTMADFNEAFNTAGSFLIRIGKSW